MIPVSDTFKLNCNKSSLEYSEYIMINSTKVVIKGSLSATAYKNTTFFGTFNLKMLKFETENDIDYKEQEVEYYKVVDGTAMKIGTFIVTEVKDNDSTETVTVTAYDYGLKFANQYESDLDYSSGSITLKDVLDECCTKCSVTLENTSITNGDFIVDENRFVIGSQFGDVVSQVAILTGGFAVINENDKLELLFYERTEDIDLDLLATENDDNLTTEDGLNLIAVETLETIYDYVELDDKRDTKKITCLSIETEDGTIVEKKDATLIALYGENWLRIVNNYFAYDTTTANALIDDIFDKIKGFGYSSFVSKFSFKPYYQVGDLIRFKNKDGNFVESIILKIDSKYEDITLSAPSIIDSSVEYEYPINTYDKVRTAELNIDKANANIEIKVSEDEIVSAINLSPETITINSDKLNLDGLVTITNLESNYSSDTDLATSGSTIINGENITTGSIKSSNYVVDTAGTKIDLSNGTIDTKNFKVNSSGDVSTTGDIYLTGGGQIAGDDGLKTNLQFPFYNYGWNASLPDEVTPSFFFLGYNNWYSDPPGTITNYLMADINIPDNFTVTDARITIFHFPVYWNAVGYTAVWGYCRNIKAYTVSNNDDNYVSAAYSSTYKVNNSWTTSEISGAFGTSGWTASVPSSTSTVLDEEESSNIATSLSSGNNKIIVKSGDTPPTYTSDVQTTQNTFGAKTGYATAIINVIGYFDYD